MSGTDEHALSEPLTAQDIEKLVGLFKKFVSSVSPSDAQEPSATSTRPDSVPLNCERLRMIASSVCLLQINVIHGIIRLLAQQAEANIEAVRLFEKCELLSFL